MGKTKKEEFFTMEQLIYFGNYVRKNNEKIMRKKYFDWRDQYKGFYGETFKETQIK